MTTNRSDIVAEFLGMCEQLINRVMDMPSGTQAFDVEADIFHQVLKLGAALFAAFLSTQSPLFRSATTAAPNGAMLRYRDERKGIFYSIFGEIDYTRSYYHGDTRSYYHGDAGRAMHPRVAGTGGGHFAMDAALNLPPCGPSDFRRMMLELLAIDMSFEAATKFMALYFPVTTSTRALQEAIATDSESAQQFMDQLDPPAICASIVVVQSDGKGVPIVPRQRGSAPAGKSGGTSETMIAVQPEQMERSRRREGKTKEATVVSVSLHAPRVRTPSQVHASLFKMKPDANKPDANKPDANKPDANKPDANKPDANAPSGAKLAGSADDPELRYTDPAESLLYKRVWASLEGKRPALRQAEKWAKQMETIETVYRLRLSDGQPGLLKANAEVLPDYVPVLDLMHALGKLWAAADIKFGRADAKGWNWAHRAALQLLNGESPQIVAELDGWLEHKPEGEGKVRLGNICNYLEANEAAMRYDEFLAKGWPIASGIIEGACRHVIKDRVERSGMQWTIEGVTSFLHLRCIHINGDWEAYHKFRVSKRGERLRYKPTPMGPGDESNVHQYRTCTERAIAV